MLAGFLITDKLDADDASRRIIIGTQQFGRRMAAAPALLFGIGLLDDVAIREVQMNGGPATVIEDFDDNGHSERVAVVWSVADRIYLLSGKVGQEQAVAIANAVQ